jgi:beta-glucanase (GH16 family)
MKAAVCNAFWLYDPLSDEPKKKYRPGDFTEEIDIFELFGKEGSKQSDCARAFYNTVHRLGTPYLEGRVFGSVEKLPDKSSRKKVDFDFADGYHVYGFLWTEKEMKWYADGVEMFSRPNDHFHRPMHVTFDCEIMYDWVGEPDKADLPQTFSVQYFRYWRKP